MIDNHRHTNSFKCKYHNSGYCKFGDHCRKRHYKQICQKSNCRNDCQARHPVLCKYGQDCKFSKKGICAYKHTTAIDNLENKSSEVKIKISKTVYKKKKKHCVMKLIN